MRKQTHFFFLSKQEEKGLALLPSFLSLYGDWSGVTFFFFMDHQPFSTATGHESMHYDMVGHYPAQQQQSPTQPYVTAQPVPIPPKSAHANTFVHKLYK